MADQRVCRMHGGSTPRALQAAASRRRETEATALVATLWDPDAAPITDAVSALQRLAGQMQHSLNHLGERLAVGEVCVTCGLGPLDLGSAEGVAWTRVMRELRQGLEGMERLGLAERAVELESARVQLVAGAVGAVFDALGLEPEARARGMQVLLEELRAGDAAGVLVAGEVEG